MAERQRIALTFSYDEQWIAGTYYILNIIHALKLLPEPNLPEIVIISDDKNNFEIVKKETGYPRLDFFRFPTELPVYSSLDRFVNKIGLRLLGKKLINKKPTTLKVDFVYPFHIGDYPILPKSQVNWVPDFQEIHLPNLFSTEVIAKRKHRLEAVVCKGDWVVFSSKDSQNDFRTHYPEAKIGQFVLPFAVTHAEFEFHNLKDLREKYNLPERYFFAPNQFWSHKNHMIILKAIRHLRELDVNIVVAFSGKENDHRNLEYTTKLKQYIKENNIEQNIRFLGFLPRTEQLKLMQGALAIVQPSRFEGWSTVVEDAKALNKFLVLSHISVHREQIDQNAQFFDPDNYTELSELLKQYWEHPPKVESNNYLEHRLEFANNFMKMAKRITTEKG